MLLKRNGLFHLHGRCVQTVSVYVVASRYLDIGRDNARASNRRPVRTEYYITRWTARAGLLIPQFVCTRYVVLRYFARNKSRTPFFGMDVVRYAPPHPPVNLPESNSTRINVRTGDYYDAGNEISLGIEYSPLGVPALTFFGPIRHLLSVIFLWRKLGKGNRSARARGRFSITTHSTIFTRE